MSVRQQNGIILLRLLKKHGNALWYSPYFDVISFVLSFPGVQGTVHASMMKLPRNMSDHNCKFKQ